MNFAAPQMLWLLVVVLPPLVAFFWWAWRKRQQLITQFISARLLAHLKVGVSAARQKTRMALIVVTVALLIFALARPQWGFVQEEARQRGLDIIVAVDTSNSMLAQAVAPARLTRATLAALDLVQRAKTDRLGLIAFAGSAFLECPLTLDDAAFSASVNSLDTHTISQGGTAIAEGIDEARQAFKKEPGNHKVLVLFTDGEDQDSDAVPAAKRAADDGIIILTVGVGTAEGDVLRIRDQSGRQDYIRDDDGKPVKSHMSEELLQQIAQAGKGFYLPLRGTKTMDTLYDQGIAPLPKSEFSAKYFQHYRERFYWPLSLAMLLLIVEMFLPDRKRRRSQSAVPAAVTASPAAEIAQTAVLILLLALPLAARAGSPSGALREYNQGKFEDALKDYDQLLEKKSDDPRLHFNAGAAAYQSEKMTDAAREFNEAATTSPDDLPLQQRAYYNEGNAYYRLGQQIQDPDKKQEAWENALQYYTNALSLNRQDADAAFNRDFVQRQIEELKQQQSQQSKNGKQQQQKDQKQDQKNQNQQGSQNDQQKDSSNQNQDQKQDQSQQPQKNSQGPDKDKKEAQNQPDQQKKPGDKSDEQQQKDQADKKNEEAKNQNGGQAGNESPNQAQQEAAMMAAGQMTPQQAQKLLDAQKDDEPVLRLAPPNNNTSQTRSLKNW